MTVIKLLFSLFPDGRILRSARVSSGTFLLNPGTHTGYIFHLIMCACHVALQMFNVVIPYSMSKYGLNAQFKHSLHVGNQSIGISTYNEVYSAYSGLKFIIARTIFQQRKHALYNPPNVHPVRIPINTHSPYT